MSVTNEKAYLDQVPATNTTLYTCSLNSTGRVLKCTATNDTTSTVTITFHKVESGGSVADDRLIMNAKILGPKETYLCPEVVGQLLEAGDFINGIAETASQVTVALDVVETTV